MRVYPVWAEQFGTKRADIINDMSLDHRSRNLYICGAIKTRFGSFGSGGPGGHPFLARYTTERERKWLVKFGEKRASAEAVSWLRTDESVFVAVNQFFTSGKHDAEFRKFDATDGSELWTIILGDTDDPDYADGIATDSKGFVYVAGLSFGSLLGKEGA